MQDVAVKVLAASPTEAIQLHALKKVRPCLATLIMLRMPGKVICSQTLICSGHCYISIFTLKRMCPWLAMLITLRMPGKVTRTETLICIVYCYMEKTTRMNSEQGMRNKVSPSSLLSDNITHYWSCAVIIVAPVRQFSILGAAVRAPDGCAHPGLGAGCIH